MCRTRSDNNWAPKLLKERLQQRVEYEDHRPFVVQFILSGEEAIGTDYSAMLRTKAISLGIRGWAAQATRTDVVGLMAGQEEDLDAMKEWMRSIVRESPPPGKVDRLRLLGEHRFRTRHYFPARFVCLPSTDLFLTPPQICRPQADTQ